MCNHKSITLQLTITYIHFELFFFIFIKSRAMVIHLHKAIPLFLSLWGGINLRRTYSQYFSNKLSEFKWETAPKFSLLWCRNTRPCACNYVFREGQDILSCICILLEILKWIVIAIRQKHRELSETVEKTYPINSQREKKIQLRNLCICYLFYFRSIGKCQGWRVFKLHKYKLFWKI